MQSELFSNKKANLILEKRAGQNIESHLKLKNKKHTLIKNWRKQTNIPKNWSEINNNYTIEHFFSKKNTAQGTEHENKRSPAFSELSSNSQQLDPNSQNQPPKNDIQNVNKNKENASPATASISNQQALSLNIDHISKTQFSSPIDSYQQPIYLTYTPQFYISFSPIGTMLVANQSNTTSTILPAQAQLNSAEVAPLAQEQKGQWQWQPQFFMPFPQTVRDNIFEDSLKLTAVNGKDSRTQP